MSEVGFWYLNPAVNNWCHGLCAGVGLVGVLCFWCFSRCPLSGWAVEGVGLALGAKFVVAELFCSLCKVQAGCGSCAGCTFVA